MNTTLHLEWWFNATWNRIGWTADTSQSKDDLREHGKALAARGGHYRLVTPSHLADAPPIVVHEYPVVMAGASS